MKLRLHAVEGAGEITTSVKESFMMKAGLEATNNRHRVFKEPRFKFHIRFRKAEPSLSTPSLAKPITWHTKDPRYLQIPGKEIVT